MINATAGASPPERVIVIGASAGGVEALAYLVAQLPVNVGAALFVVVHIPSNATSVLPKILSRSGRVPAVHAQNEMRIEGGRIYVAPPDMHLLVFPGHIRTVRGPLENGHRPSVDPLFRSAAEAYGDRVISVILTGNLDDGTAGMHEVKKLGGVAIVQDPAEALHSGMPRSAIDHVAVDYILPLSDIVPTIVRLLSEPVKAPEVPRGP